MEIIFQEQRGVETDVTKLGIVAQLDQIGILRPDLRVAGLGVLRIAIVDLGSDLPPLRAIDAPGKVEVQFADVFTSELFGQEYAGVEAGHVIAEAAAGAVE